MRTRLLFFWTKWNFSIFVELQCYAVLVLNVAVLEAVICFSGGDYCPGGKLYQNRLQYTGFTLYHRSVHAPSILLMRLPLWTTEIEIRSVLLFRGLTSGMKFGCLRALFELPTLSLGEQHCFAMVWYLFTSLLLIHSFPKPHLSGDQMGMR